MHEPDYVLLLLDRYGGAYSGGTWVAVAIMTETLFVELEARINGGDGTADEFWEANREQPWIGVGRTPQEALKDVLRRWGRHVAEHGVDEIRWIDDEAEPSGGR